MGLDLGIGIKLAFDGFNGIRDKQTSLKVLGRVAKLSADDMNKLNASITKLNKLDIKTKLASQELKNFKDELSGNLARIGALAVPVKFAGDFESALADFNNAAKLSDFELKDMSEYFLKLSNHINISSTQIASLGQNIAKLGVPKSDLKDYLSSAAKLQLALGFSTEETNQMLSSLGTHFKLTSKDVLGLGDEIFTLGNKFNASAKSIANLTSKISANAKMFGLSANESAVLSAAFLQVAKDEGQAEGAINSLSEKLINITSLGDNVKSSIANLGMDATQIEIGMKIDPKQTLDLFFNRLKITKNANEKQYNELLASMFGGNASVMNAFVGNLDKYNEATANIGKNKGALDDEVKAVKSLFNTRVGVFTNNLKNLGIQVGNVFLPVVSSLVDKLGGMLSFASDMITRFPTLSKVVIGGVGAFLSLQVALSSLRAASAGFSLLSGNMAKNMIFLKAKTIGLNKMIKDELFASLVGSEIRFKKAMLSSLAFSKSLITSPIKTCKKALLSFASSLGGGLLKGLKAATLGVRVFNLSLLANPIGLIIAGVSALAFVIYKNFGKIKAFCGGLWDGLSEGLAPVIETFKSVFSPLLDGISWVWDKAKALFSFLFGGGEESAESIEKAGNAGKKFGNFLASSLKIITLPLQILIKGFGLLKDGISGACSFISDKFSKAGEFISNIGSNIKKGWDSVCSGISNAVSAPIDFIKNGFNSLWDNVNAGFDSFCSFFSEGASSVADFFTSPIETIKGNFSAAFEWISSKFEWISDVASSIGSWFGFGDDNKKDKKDKKQKASSIQPVKAEVVYEQPKTQKEIKQALNTNSKTTTNNKIDVVINMSDFKIATSNGNFNLAEFQAQVIKAAKLAIEKVADNKKNRSVVSDF